jgi:putative phosphonate metabolism protein
MNAMTRYAVYYAPREDALSFRAAEWLGRDPVTGVDLPQPVLEGIGDPRAITAEPRRYGFHGTLRAPFRPAEGLSEAQIHDTVAVLATRLAPVACESLRVESLDGFIALTPVGCEAALLDLAAAVVEGTNDLRAPLTEVEIARRRPDRLSPHQRALLQRWGYPFVMDEFRFHLTLTDRLPDPEPALSALKSYFTPVLPSPFVIEDLCLFGEDGTGRFHLLHRYALTG